ncbi:MAG TPA: carboxypeptidase-like regulatory domain-containing protein [Acidobacteriaceae bacterium]|nr:carboxypeptidase-like regulatory domain-containing protein [Acidobacteriaceae bacterium]
MSGILALRGQGQSISVPSAAPQVSPTAARGEPGSNASTDRSVVASGDPVRAQNQQTPDPQSTGSIVGTVEDSNGNVIPGAAVALKMLNQSQNQDRTVRTGSNGFFQFDGLPAETFLLTVTSQGFETWTGPPINLAPRQHYVVPGIALQVASATTSVRVVPTRQQIAEEQLHAEEKQRVLGVFPNFYTTYVWNAEPLTARQKFQLAWKSSIDPVTFAVTGAVAGVEQWQNYFSGYGTGAEGFGKRYGAAFADDFVGNMIGGAVLPVLLHQDPRFFFKATGSVESRALYAMATVVITKGDNGRWQPNYSNVLGTFAAAGISNLYYPSSNQTGAQLTIENSLIGLAASAGGALLQEFVIKKISTGVQPVPTVQPAPASHP